KKINAKIDNPRSAGIFTRAEADERGVRLVEGIEGKVEDGNCIQLYWLVDKEDGAIIDARFQVYGQTALIAAADATCDLLVGKNYDQARRITADLIDK